MSNQMTDGTVERLLEVEERAPSDPRIALERFRATVRSQGIQAHRTARTGWLRFGAGAVAAIALSVGLAASGAAESFFTVFQPKQVAPVTVTRGDLASLPDLSAYGTLTWTAPPRPEPVQTIAEAERSTGIAALRVASPPDGVTGSPRLFTVARAHGQFVFDQAKLTANADRLGRTPPPMPAAIASSTLNFSGGPAVVQIYGGSADPTSLAGALPSLLVVQSKAPVVTSDGATVDELRTYLLAQPGLSPELAAQIRAIGDPTATLLLPIPVDFGSGKAVTVRGVPGVFMGDSTGLGSAVIWVADGLVHLVAGTLGEADLLAVANSLR